ncbi:MAG: hypothetical protein ACREBF_04380 [Candidatus Micrarchaeales archaeon]
MRLQLSFEFLTYLTLAGLSLLFSLGTLHIWAASIYDGISHYHISVLASSLNAAMLVNSQYTNISTFLPAGMCNSTVRNGELYTPYGNFSLAEGIATVNNPFCPDGEPAELLLKDANGDFQISRLN